MKTCQLWSWKKVSSHLVSHTTFSRLRLEIKESRVFLIYDETFLSTQGNNCNHTSNCQFYFHETLALSSPIKHVVSILHCALLHNFPPMGHLLQFQKSRPHDGHDLQYVTITRVGISRSQSETLGFNLTLVTVSTDKIGYALSVTLQSRRVFGVWRQINDSEWGPRDS